MSRQTVCRARSIAFAVLAPVLAMCLCQGAFPAATMESYVSEVDGSEQPFGLYIPEPFDPDVPHPVVLHLHGGGGRANASFPMSSYADANGWILANPDGRGEHNLFLGVARQDLLEVLKELRARYPNGIDEDRIYLEGCSMGGMGACWLGFAQPDLCAAVAGVDGGYNLYLFYQGWMTPAGEPDEVDPRRAPLLEGISCKHVAENARNLGLYVGVDTADGSCPPINSYELHDRLNDLGYAHSYNVFSGGHCDGYNVSAIYEFFSQHIRQPNPQHTTLKTNQLKYGSAYWARVDRLAKSMQFATIEARITGKQNDRVEVTATGLLQFTLFLTPELMEVDEVSVLSNGELVYTGPPEEITVSASLDESGSIIGWHTDDSPLRGLRKTARIEGPLGHAYESKFLMVKGTIGSKIENSQNSSEAAQFAADWNLRNHANISSVDDTSVTESDIAACNLILFGTADSNSIIGAINDLLPIRIWRDRIVAGANEFVGDNYGLYMIFPNPLNRQRYVVIGHGTIRGITASDMLGLPFFWPDYAVFDTTIDPRPAIRSSPYGDAWVHLPDAWVEAGFFDQYWRLDNDEDGLDDIYEKEIIDTDPDDAITGIEDVNPQDDFDGDSQDNRTEYKAGTDGTDPESLFSVLSVNPHPTDVAHFQVSWKLAAGRSYCVLWAGSANGPWREIEELNPDDLSDNGDTRTWTDRGTDPAMEGTKPGDCATRFYKVMAYR